MNWYLPPSKRDEIVFGTHWHSFLRGAELITQCGKHTLSLCPLTMAYEMFCVDFYHCHCSLGMTQECHDCKELRCQLGHMCQREVWQAVP